MKTTPVTKTGSLVVITVCVVAISAAAAFLVYLASNTTQMMTNNSANVSNRNSSVLPVYRSTRPQPPGNLRMLNIRRSR